MISHRDWTEFSGFAIQPKLIESEPTFRRLPPIPKKAAAKSAKNAATGKTIGRVFTVNEAGEVIQTSIANPVAYTTGAKESLRRLELQIESNANPDNDQPNGPSKDTDLGRR